MVRPSATKDHEVPALARRSGPNLQLVAAIFAVAVVTIVTRSVMGQGSRPFFGDTDDAMRMVMVRDFIAGQNWFDLSAHRLNTPWGAELHWSRLVDLPIGAIVLLFTPPLGETGAMTAAGYVWPMLLLALLLWVSAALANRLVGPEGVLPAAVLPVLNPAIVAEFTPGRVDHHNVIILLTLTLLWTTVEALQRPRFAILAGIIAATALAIATESLPPVAAAILVMGLLWVIDPARAGAMRGFGLAFGTASLLHLALFRPPARWLEAACDVLSPFYVGIALVVAVVFTLASTLPLAKAWQRLGLLAVLGVMGLALMLRLYPECLGGPYGELDPWLQQNWIGGIFEARPWLVTLNELPGYAIAVGIPVLVALVTVGIRLWRVRDDREGWAVLLVFLLLTSVIMLVQVRGARLAVMPAMPAAAWLIVSARRRYLAHPRWPQILALVSSWLVFAGVVLSLLVTFVVERFPSHAQYVAQVQGDKDQCLLPSAFADLSALPPERIMSPIDLGAHLLLETPHEVVSAPYHRNERGVRDTFRFFNDPIDTARQILSERGIGLVVICPAMPEVQGLPSQTADSFATLRREGRLPDWLSNVSLPGSPFEVYAVLPQ